MSWDTIADAFGFAGEVLSVALLSYGAWLSLTAGRLEQRRERDRAVREAADSSEEAGTSSVSALGISFLVLCGVCLPGIPVPAQASGPLERGLDAYERMRYAEAVVQLQAAAGAGDSRAEEILGFMYLQGAAFYGAAVPFDRERALLWFVRAARHGREVSQHMLCVLTGRPSDTVIHRAQCAGPHAVREEHP